MLAKLLCLLGLLAPSSAAVIGIDFGGWDEGNGILTDDGAVFFLDPDHGAVSHSHSAAAGSA